MKYKIKQLGAGAEETARIVKEFDSLDEAIESANWWSWLYKGGSSYIQKTTQLSKNIFWIEDRTGKKVWEYGKK